MKYVLAVTALLMSTATFATIDPDARRMNKELSGEGAREVTYTKIKMLPNQEHNHTLRAKAGMVYHAYGDCDDECTDLDLAVIDSKGVMLEADTELDSVPLFSWTAPSSGTYTFRLRMVDCAIESGCEASLNIYESRP